MRKFAACGEKYLCSPIWAAPTARSSTTSASSRQELASGDQVQVGRTVMLFTGPGDSGPQNIGERGAHRQHARPARRARGSSARCAQQEGSALLTPAIDAAENPWLARARSNLQIMYRTALAVSHTLDIDQLLSRIMQLIFEWVEADRGCIMLVDPETKTARAQGAPRPAAISTATSR